MNLSLEEQQIELDSIEEGIETYRRTVESRPFHELTVGQREIRGLMINLVTAIEKFQEAWLSGEAVPYSREIGPVMCGIPAPDLALITLSCAYDKGYEGITFTGMAGTIGTYVNNYLRSNQMKKISRDKYKAAVTKFKNINLRKYNLTVKHFEGDIQSLTHSQRMKIGAKLMGFCIEYTDAFDYYFYYTNKNKTQYMFNLKTEVRERIAKEHSDLEILRPALKPMVVTPQDWTSLNEGGYLFHQHTAIKPMKGLDNGAINKQRGDTIEYLFPYLNLLQKTSFKIDTDNLDTLSKIVDMGGNMAGIPRQLPYPFPPKPVDIDDNPDSKASWKLEASLVYTKNNKLAGQKVATNSIVKLAKEFSKYEEIYNEWTADFRLRGYPSCTVLSPQSSDIGKGLLRFARGVPLGDSGFKWLSISLCNNIGEDKLSFSDRVTYVRDCESILRSVVKDPLNNTEWMQWDEPFKGLLTAREWVEALSDPTGYVSHVPVCVDGTCNGFQHYAAINRDPIIGRYVNLIHSDRPESMYTYVANAAIQINEHDCATTPYSTQGVTNPCHAWAGKIGKPVVKQPTMTTPYSVTPMGVLRQIYDNVDLSELEGDRRENLRYAQQIVLRAIQETATSASETMEWLRQIAYASAKQDKNLVWTHPTGVKIVQRYPKFSDSSFYTEFHRVYWRDPRKDSKEKISPFKHCNAIAPNFIHSLDAAHMYFTCAAAKRELGIQDFALAHDSYGVHAGNMEAFKPLITREFVNLHQTCWLTKLYEEASQYLDLSDVSPLPPKGSLNLNDVLKSEYLFH